MPPGRGLSRLSKQLSPLIKSLEKVLHSLGPSQCFYLIEILEFVIILENRAEELEDLRELSRFSVNIVRLCIQAEAFGNSDINEKVNKVIQAIFTILKQDITIFQEILEELYDDRVENWHSYDENVKKYLVKRVFCISKENFCLKYWRWDFDWVIY